jgi:hypothetical protein
MLILHTVDIAKIGNGKKYIPCYCLFKRTEAFHLELKVAVADSFRNSVNAVQDEREVLLGVHAPFIHKISSETNKLGIKLSMVEQCANVAIIYNFG